MDRDSTVTLNSGREMPVLGLGTWALREDTAGTIVAALKMGYRMIDTSGDYGTQPGIGQGLKQGGFGRDDYYLVTKIENHDDAYQATKKNLAELGLDYADMMLIHWPPHSGAGLDLWQGLRQARDEGLTRDIGVSNYSIEQIEELIEKSGETPAVNQVKWSPFGWSRPMLEYCQGKGIIIQAYSPLTHGRRLDDKVLGGIAAKHKVAPALVLLRWSLQSGAVPIVKANQLEHLKQNLEVFKFKLDGADMEKLNGLNE